MDVEADNLDQEWRTYRGRVPRFSLNFEEILSRVHGVLEYFTFIINYLITIIINAYYN